MKSDRLKCIIIDDDPLITDLVLHYAEKMDAIDYCIVCNDPIAGLKLLGNGSFDILFLDLNMPILDGKHILELKQDSSKVVMVTSDKYFAVESYRYDQVVDYLVKPLEYDRFVEAVNRCISYEEPKILDKTEPSKIIVKDGNKWIPVDIADILFVKSESNYCMIHTNKEDIMTLSSLKDLMVKLPIDFIQCHRSYIINTQKLDYLTKEEISINGQIIPISNKYKEGVMSFINGKV